VSSVEEIDEAIRRTPTGGRVLLSVVARGEHVEWPGFVATDELKGRASPSGLTGGGPTRRFRASGWTRHYVTYAEVLQMVAQLALGLALAALLRRRRGAAAWLPFAAFVLLGAGIALTAMRTTLAAFAVGALVVAWRATTRGRARVFVVAAVAFALAFGAVVVWRTRAGGALTLSDPSASLRVQVARVAAGRVPLHPVFGHGMDAVQRHWQEWGFPGTDMLHTHSTPLQLAFDRGLPAVLFWLWLLAAFWLAATRAERLWRDTDDAATHGLALGATGALAGFAASSLVNYNFGDSEVALLLWWLMGAIVVVSREQ
jgi:O-antigen ligase